MPIELHELRSRSFHGTKRRIYHLLEEMGTSGDQIWPFASQPFMRSPGPLTAGRTEEWHLGYATPFSRRLYPKSASSGDFETKASMARTASISRREGKETLLEYRVDAMLSDTDGRLLWRRFEDQFERSTEALFDKLARVLKR